MNESFDEWQTNTYTKVLQDSITNDYMPKADASREIDRLRAFALGCLAEWPDVGMDGFDLQELAVKTGMLEAHTVTEPCGESCNCIEYHGSDGFNGGVVCYRKTALLRGD